MEKVKKFIMKVLDLKSDYVFEGKVKGYNEYDFVYIHENLPYAPQSLSYITRNLIVNGLNSSDDKKTEILIDRLDNVTGGLDLFIEKLIFHYFIYGRAIIRIEWKKAGNIQTGIGIYDELVIEEDNKFEFTDGVIKYSKNGQPIDLDNYLIFKRGISKFGKSIYYNNPGVSETIIAIIKDNLLTIKDQRRHPVHIAVDNPQEFTEEYKNNFNNLSDKNKTIITDKGVEITKLFGNEQQFYNYLDFMDKLGNVHAPSLFGIPFSEISNIEASYNNATQGYITAQKTAIIPLQDILQRFLNKYVVPFLSPDFKDLELYIERSNIGARYENGELFKSLADNGYITANELRAIVDSYNLGPIDSDWADEHRVMNLRSSIKMDELNDLENDGNAFTPNKQLVNMKRYENMTFSDI